MNSFLENNTIQSDVTTYFAAREQEARALMLAARSNRYGERDHLIIGLIYLHGLSIRDLVGLRAYDVDGAHLQLRRATAGDCVLKLNPSLAKLARSLTTANVDHFLFRSQMGGALKRQAINYMIQITSEKIGVLPFSPSELRHLHGFNLAAEGRSEDEISTALGIVDKAHVQRYFRPYVSESTSAE